MRRTSAGVSRLNQAERIGAIIRPTPGAKTKHSRWTTSVPASAGSQLNDPSKLRTGQGTLILWKSRREYGVSLKPRITGGPGIPSTFPVCLTDPSFAVRLM